MANIMRVGGGGGGGSGLELTVVGGTTKPVNPDPNTIWVNTSTDINDVYLSAIAPDSPVAGDVWINTGIRYGTAAEPAKSSRALTVIQNPYLEINVLNLMQYDGTEWVQCTGSIYANNEWVDTALYLYWYGTQNQDYPFYGVQASDQNTAGTVMSITHRSDYFEVSTNEYFPYSGVITSLNCAVDVSNFSKVGVGFQSNQYLAQFIVGFSTNLIEQRVSMSTIVNAQQISTGSQTANVLHEYTFDITATGVVRPGFFIMNYSDYYTTTSVYYWVLT